MTVWASTISQGGEILSHDDTRSSYVSLIRPRAAREDAAEAARERDLERAARLQLSSFVRDISTVTDIAFLRARLQALRSKVKPLAMKVEQFLRQA